MLGAGLVIYIYIYLYFFRGEAEESFGLLVGRHISIVGVATGHVAVHYGKTGTTHHHLCSAFATSRYFHLPICAFTPPHMSQKPSQAIVKTLFFENLMNFHPSLLQNPNKNGEMEAQPQIKWKFLFLKGKKKIKICCLLIEKKKKPKTLQSAPF